MSRDTAPSSYLTDDLDLLREIVASADVRLQAQLTASLAADQRALVLAGFLVAVIAALVSGAVALFLQVPRQGYLAWAAIGTALGLFVSLLLTVYAARPVSWGYPGTRPQAWLRDIVSKKDAASRLSELAADYERRGRDNAALMARHGQCILAALIVAAVSILLGGATLVYFFWCRP